ncbi:TetR/AcrR family transcriptional regulator [Rugosimonospora africana]|uniref:TetR family transcriptional regulator n=1 Tax=Rugosimonospora africana TaxID=556532 RepID=A0A8J3QS83_9ACTN|nr:TetR/AcrR family transcriptional regulator [Rugosimonospora africana]GIH15302.1 TetR family transcriptional regulator [Rugosimonospora africana]
MDAETDYVYPHPARDRLLRTADRLFYAEGINAIGVERILSEAKAAKASMYSNFGSKSELVRAYLDNRSNNWRRHVEAQLGARAGRAEDQILAVFDLLGEWFQTPDYRGCPFINAAAECGTEPAVTEVTAQHRSWVRELFAGLLAQAGVRDVSKPADQLCLLYDGAMVDAQLDRSADPAKRARETAELVIAASLGVGTGRNGDSGK